MFCEIKLMSYDDGPFKYGVFVKLKVDETLYTSLKVSDNWEEAVNRAIGQCLFKAGKPNVDVRDVWAMADVQGELL